MRIAFKTLRLGVSYLLLSQGWAWPSYAQQLPAVDATSLEGKVVHCPEDLQGHPAVLAVGFTAKADSSAERWARALLSHQDIAGVADVYQIAVDTGKLKLFRSLKPRMLTRRVPASMHSHVLVVHDPSRLWLRSMNEWRSDSPYIVVLDSQARPCWRTDGQYSEDGLKAIVGAVSICSTL